MFYKNFLYCGTISTSPRAHICCNRCHKRRAKTVKRDKMAHTCVIRVTSEKLDFYINVSDWEISYPYVPKRKKTHGKWGTFPLLPVICSAGYVDTT